MRNNVVQYISHMVSAQPHFHYQMTPYVSHHLRFILHEISNLVTMPLRHLLPVSQDQDENITALNGTSKSPAVPALKIICRSDCVLAIIATYISIALRPEMVNLYQHLQ